MRLHLYIRIVCLCFLCFFVTGAISVAYAQTERRPLTPAEKRGKALYLRGESSTGKEITAIMNDIDIPASTLSCAGCHGTRGEGKTEGGVTAGSLVWSNLTKSYGHIHDNGRKHGAFSEASFIRAVTGGVDPAGNKFAVAMPAYRMPQQDMSDLIAYVKLIETDLDPGVFDNKIVVGTLLPDKNALTGLATAIEDVLRAYFSEVNSRGGIYGRKIELRVLNGNPERTVANMKQLIDDQQVFAILGGLTAGAEDGVAALTRERQVPFIGPSTLFPERSLPLNRYVFYLLPGLKEQARSLVNFAANTTDPKKARVAIVSPDAEFNKAIATSIEDQGKKLGWSALARVQYAREAFKAAESVAELKAKSVDTVFLLGSGADAARFFEAAGAADWTPTVYLLGTLVGKNAPELVPAKMKDLVFFAFPTIPSDVSAAGAAEYSGLLQRNNLRSGHAAAQASAIAAAKILVHGLELGGKDLDRERLVTALESLYEFDTGLVPKVSYGPNRRLGILGAYIITTDPERKVFPSTVTWVAVE